MEPSDVKQGTLNFAAIHIFPQEKMLILLWKSASQTESFWRVRVRVIHRNNQGAGKGGSGRNRPSCPCGKGAIIPFSPNGISAKIRPGDMLKYVRKLLSSKYHKTVELGEGYLTVFI